MLLAFPIVPGLFRRAPTFRTPGGLGWGDLGDFPLALLWLEWYLRLAFKCEFQAESSAKIKMTCSNLRWSKNLRSQSAPDFTSLNSCQLLVCALLGFALSSVAVFCQSFQLVFLSRSVQGPPYREVGAFWAWKTTEWATGGEVGRSDSSVHAFAWDFRSLAIRLGQLVSRPEWLQGGPQVMGIKQKIQHSPRNPKHRKKRKQNSNLWCLLSRMFNFQWSSFFGSCRGNGGSIGCVRLTMNCVPVWKALTGKLISSEETK